MGKLVICPTPIGNLGDMPPRALEALTGADVIFAEDTRMAAKLLSALGIGSLAHLTAALPAADGFDSGCHSNSDGCSAGDFPAASLRAAPFSMPPIQRLDENVIGERASSVVEKVLAGQTVVYVTDAGMPGVSDPGLRLVAAARKAGVPVETLPGPSAVVTAYVTSGITCPRFYFGGFFPRKDAARRALLEQLAALDAALIFYESPRRLVGALAVVADVLPLRRIAVCRELTKLHEEVVCAPAPEVAADFAARPSIRGEVVLVIDAPVAAESAQAATDAQASARARAVELLAAGERPKTIARLLAETFAIPKNQAYDLVLQLRNNP